MFDNSNVSVISEQKSIQSWGDIQWTSPKLVSCSSKLLELLWEGRWQTVSCVCEHTGYCLLPPHFANFVCTTFAIICNLNDLINPNLNNNYLTQEFSNNKHLFAKREIPCKSHG